MKRLLKGIHFQFEGAHIALTDGSQGGAASMMNDPLLLKSLGDKKLTKEQEGLLVKMGKNISEIAKATDESKDSSSSSEAIDGEDNNKVTKENQTIMSDTNVDIQKQLTELKAELAVSKAENAISKYAFEDAQGVATALSVLDKDAQEVIFKAFDGMVASTKVAIDKALEGKEQEENPLAKKLCEEVGTEEEGETVIEKTLTEKALEFKNKDKEDK